MEKLREASEKGLTEITWDESNIQITPEGLDWDYVKMLPEHLPMVRNDYAQWSTELYNWAVVSERQRGHQSALSAARVRRGCCQTALPLREGS
jgi:hypothetical protein